MMNEKIHEINYLKAIFILLMVAFHLSYIGEKYPYAKELVYTFHMSGFLIISGFLTHIEKRVGRFLRDVGWIAVMYIVAEVPYAIASHFLPVYDALPELSPLAVARAVFVRPLGPYWYFHTLILCQLLYFLTFRLGRQAGMSTFSCLLLLGSLLFGVSHFLGLTSFSDSLYFLLGAGASLSGLPFTRLFRGSAWAILPLALLALFPANFDRGTLAGVAITYLTISLLLYLCGKMRPGWMTRALDFVGENTLPILLFSPLFTFLSKKALSLFLFDPTALCFMFVTVLITVGGCIAIAFCLDKANISPLLSGRKNLIRK
ncbi:MAG: acyltransferase [Mediterranea sp.]|jgi:fucose 4-O-acetylase-like acetyltransferase|nr:acyltransferase [Mediterranea sp.]